MNKFFNGVNFVYRSVEIDRTFRSYLRILVRIQNFYNGERYKLLYTGDFPCYVLDRLFDG